MGRTVNCLVRLIDYDMITKETEDSGMRFRTATAVILLVLCSSAGAQVARVSIGLNLEG